MDSDNTVQASIVVGKIRPLRYLWSLMLRGPVDVEDHGAAMTKKRAWRNAKRALDMHTQFDGKVTE